MISIDLTQKQAEALYNTLLALDEAQLYQDKYDGPLFEDAPEGHARQRLREAWYKVAKKLGHAI